MKKPSFIAALLLGSAIMTTGSARAQVGGTPAGTPASEREPQPLLESAPNGYIDWGRGVAGAWGRTRDVRGDGTREEILMRRSAELNARANLLAIVQRARATSEIRVGDRPDLVEKVRGILTGAVAIRDRAGRGGPFFEILVEAPLNGVQGISYSVYEITYPKKTDAPGGVSADPSGGTAEGDEPRAVAAEPMPDAPTGIVIDARGTGLAPALLPRIVDESGTVIASPSTVDDSALKERGMAAYGTLPANTSEWRDRVGDRPLWIYASSAGNAAPAAPAAESTSNPLVTRKGPRPYKLKAASSTGSLKADIILSKADAERLEKTPGAAAALKDCRVIVIVESPVGGVEGVRGRVLPHPAPRAAAGRAWRHPRG